MSLGVIEEEYLDWEVKDDVGVFDLQNEYSPDRILCSIEDILIRLDNDGNLKRCLRLN